MLSQGSRGYNFCTSTRFVSTTVVSRAISHRQFRWQEHPWGIWCDLGEDTMPDGLGNVELHATRNLYLLVEWWERLYVNKGASEHLNCVFLEERTIFNIMVLFSENHVKYQFLSLSCASGAYKTCCGTHIKDIDVRLTSIAHLCQIDKYRSFVDLGLVSNKELDRRRALRTGKCP